ncbi:hypothetical protein GCM10009678_86560 [Actinomadura kijaniata]|uniref:Uncharacterized protein n=1 Tax=Actinomadura namibiensis TaxID=182080 RepID=A0A7W3M0R0_ACTNM|nr:hypothetical protein [Actinomadura namibiensis]MBA8957727.1 hypothetical protein [Actinomadura namibiensis]
MDDTSDATARIGRARRRTTPYVPVRLREDTGSPGSLRLLTFTGSEEAELLHAAADWLGGHRFAIVVAMNWMGDLGAHSEDDPLYELRVVVDLTLYTDLGYRD